MSVPALLSNPGLALSGACFDLDDLQALVDDYEGRIAEERNRREKAEAHLESCLSKIGSLEGELAKVKNLVMGALVKVQATAPMPVTTTAAPKAAAPVAAAPKAAAPVAAAPKAPAPVAAAPKAAAPRPTAVAPAKAPAMAGQVPFSAPRSATAAMTSTTTARTPEPANDNGHKPKRRIMRSRR